MKKLFEMIFVFGIACFLVAILAFSFTDQAQGRGTDSTSNGNSVNTISQKVLLDSINRMQSIKRMLDRKIDSMESKAQYNRRLVLAGFRKLEPPKIIIIRDTIPIYIPIPIRDTPFKNINAIIHNLN